MMQEETDTNIITIASTTSITNHEIALEQMPVKQSIVKKRNILEQIKDKMEDQDFNQKVAVSISVILELYRVLVSSFCPAKVRRPRLLSQWKHGPWKPPLFSRSCFQLYNNGLFFSNVYIWN